MCTKFSRFDEIFEHYGSARWVKTNNFQTHWGYSLKLTKYIITLRKRMLKIHTMKLTKCISYTQNHTHTYEMTFLFIPITFNWNQVLLFNFTVNLAQALLYGRSIVFAVVVCTIIMHFTLLQQQKQHARSNCMSVWMGASMRYSVDILFRA